MRLLDANNAPVQSNVQTADIAFSIGDPAIVIDILRSRLYQNPIQTLTQEYLSNARDAQIEAKSKIPIQIGVPSYTDLKFSVRDYGLGLSLERVRDVFVRYGVSTKRDNDDQTGAFGIGGKSAWSYADSFIITSWRGGMKRDYVAHLGSGNEGTLSLLGESQSEEPTGVRIEVPVKSGDVESFVKAIIRATFLWSEEVVYSRPVALPEKCGKSVNGIHIFLNGGKIEKDNCCSASAVDGGYYVAANGIPYVFDGEVKIDGAKIELPPYYLFVVDCNIQKLRVAASREAYAGKEYATEKMMKAVTSLRDGVKRQLRCEPSSFIKRLIKLSDDGMSFLYKSISVWDGIAEIRDWSKASARLTFTNGVTKVISVRTATRGEEEYPYVDGFNIFFDNKIEKTFYRLENVVPVVGSAKNKRTWKFSDVDRKQLNKVTRVAGSFSSGGKTILLAAMPLYADEDQMVDGLPEAQLEHEKALKAVEEHFGIIKPFLDYDLTPYKNSVKRDPFSYKVFKISKLQRDRYYSTSYGQGTVELLDKTLKDCEDAGQMLVYCNKESTSYPNIAGYWNDICQNFSLKFKIRCVVSKKTADHLDKLKIEGKAIPFDDFLVRVQTEPKFSEIKNWAYVKENHRRFDNIFELNKSVEDLDPIFSQIKVLKKYAGDRRDGVLAYHPALMGISKSVFEMPHLKALQDKYPLLFHVSVNSETQPLIKEYVLMRQQKMVGVINGSV